MLTLKNLLPAAIILLIVVDLLCFAFVFMYCQKKSYAFTDPKPFFFFLRRSERLGLLARKAHARMQIGRAESNSMFVPKT
jgi:hypothetical protein